MTTNQTFTINEDNHKAEIIITQWKKEGVNISDKICQLIIKDYLESKKEPPTINDVRNYIMLANKMLNTHTLDLQIVPK